MPDMVYATPLSSFSRQDPLDGSADEEGDSAFPTLADAGRAGARGQSAPSGVNLASVDLNLLVALEALLDQRSVTHAARRVGLSQPAMSRSLSRLRFMFNDDLLVRTSTGLVCTARGEELFSRLPQLLSTVRELVSSCDFKPGQWQSTVKIAMADHQALVLLMPLIERINARAHHIQVAAEPLARGTLRRLESGEIDFATG